MRSEREIRSYRDDIIRHMEIGDCQIEDCENCARLEVAIDTLSWCMGESVEYVERYIEAIAKQVRTA